VVLAPWEPRPLNVTILDMNEKVVRVLIVDDQAPFRAAARDVVELADGFEVVGEAETGEASLESVRDLKPDLVLMDLNLPGIDGLEATRRILGDNPEQVIILVLSTYDADEMTPRVLEAGAFAYIPKAQFGPDELEEAWAEASG
jgi:DNA-binding NarL/FixJ family response regulator